MLRVVMVCGGGGGGFGGMLLVVGVEGVRVEVETGVGEVAG